MLSIQLSEDIEWWVNSTIFERVLGDAVANGMLPATFRELSLIAAANGGFSPLSDDKWLQLIAGLRAMALVELKQPTTCGDTELDFSYHVGLQRLLEITSQISMVARR